MNCQENKPGSNCEENKTAGCGGCGQSTIKVGRWWNKVVYVPRKGNEEFLAAMNSITPEKAKEMGQEALDTYFKSVKPPTILEEDFLDQKPVPMHTNDGKILYWRGGQQHEITAFISAEVIQVALCTDPKCSDPACLKYQDEIKAKVASGFLKIVK